MSALMIGVDGKQGLLIDLVRVCRRLGDFRCTEFGGSEDTALRRCTMVGGSDDRYHL